MKIHPSVYQAEGVRITGDVIIGEKSSVWYNAVIRADAQPVVIGKKSNIQDGVIIHCAQQIPVTIGDRVTVGHGAIIHGCTIEDGCLIGMGAIVLNGAVVREGAIVAAGSLVPQGMEIPAGMLAMGNPAKVRGPIREEHRGMHKQTVETYVRNAEQKKNEQE